MQPPVTQAKLRFKWFLVSYLWHVAKADLCRHGTFDALHGHRNVPITDQRQQQNVSLQIVLGIDAQPRNVQVKGKHLLLQVQPK